MPGTILVAEVTKAECTLRSHVVFMRIEQRVAVVASGPRLSSKICPLAAPRTRQAENDFSSVHTRAEIEQLIVALILNSVFVRGSSLIRRLQ